jgi:Flp pilus assembly protein TadG
MLRRSNARRGASAVEMAVATPVFLMMVFAIFDFGRFFLVRHTMDSAVRAATRYAVVKTDTATVADVKAIAAKQVDAVKKCFVGSTYATDVFWVNSAVSGGAKEYPFTAAPWGESIGVSATANYRPVFRLVFGGSTSIELNSACYMLSEGN